MLDNWNVDAPQLKPCGCPLHCFPEARRGGTGREGNRRLRSYLGTLAIRWAADRILRTERGVSPNPAPSAMSSRTAEDRLRCSTRRLVICAIALGLTSSEIHRELDRKAARSVDTTSAPRHWPLATLAPSLPRGRPWQHGRILSLRYHVHRCHGNDLARLAAHPPPDQVGANLVRSAFRMRNRPHTIYGRCTGI